MLHRMLLFAGMAAFLLALPVLARQPISIEDAKRIALENGMAEIEEIGREDDGGWDVEGRDGAGKELELKISASGEVTERDD